MSRSSLALTAALFVAWVPSVAVAAPSKAWTAAKKAHVDAPIIAGLDVASAKSSQSFTQFYPLLLASKSDVKEVLDKLQDQCKFDPFVAVNSVVAVIDNENDNKGAFYIALKGWDATKLGTCAKKLAKSEGKEIVVGPVKKGIQQYEMKGKDEKLYLGWVGKDVLVVATDPKDKSLVEQAIGGKGKGQANQLASKLDTSSTMWMVVIKSQSVQPGIDMKALYGTVKVANGNVDSNIRVLTGDATQATQLVTTFNKELPNLGKSLPPAAASLVKTLKLTSTGAEVQASASAPEKDLLALVTSMLLKFKP
jgi:hypothetical protein